MGLTTRSAGANWPPRLNIVIESSADRQQRRPLIMLCASIFRYGSWIIAIIHEIVGRHSRPPRPAHRHGNALGEKDFDAAWAEGTALSTEEAIAYAQRGRGQRKRPTTGWASLTPTECDVVRLVSDGLANNDIATRLFVSPRTVQTHLTHVYTKLGLSSRVQLVQEAARHT